VAEIRWRAATADDVGRLARFADRLGDDWTYGMLTRVWTEEQYWFCCQMENEWSEEFFICQVQDVIADALASEQEV